MPSSRCAIALAIVLGSSSSSYADDESPLPEASYLWDGGALLSVWGALGLRVVLDRYTEARATPLMFSATDGGAPRPRWEIPGWTVTASAGVLAGGMLLGGDGSRWYHIKGLAETLSTGALVTGELKAVFARHRPDWDPATDRPDDRRSFPSGHTTQAFQIATYASLYLRQHVFDMHRDRDEWPFYELATYAGLYAAASAVAYERVAHNQHHVSDVLVGAALGTAGSWVFFNYQERRYRSRRAREAGRDITPLVGAHIAGVQLGWAW